MVNRRQARQPRWIALATIGAMVLSAPILTGCSSTPTTAQQHHDPLHGVLVPPGAAPQPTNTPKASNNTLTPPQTGSINGIPPIPTNNTATNPATLASMSFQVPLGKPLAIEDDSRTSPTARTQPSGYIPPNSAPRVEPVPDLHATPPSLPPAAWQAPSASIDPADTLRQQLQARGVVNQKLYPTADGVRLTCYVPRKDSDGIRVLQANGSDYADAAQAILRQLDPRP